MYTHLIDMFVHGVGDTLKAFFFVLESAGKVKFDSIHTFPLTFFCIYFLKKALNAQPCVEIYFMQNGLFSFSSGCKFLRKLPGSDEAGGRGRITETVLAVSYIQGNRTGWLRAAAVDTTPWNHSHPLKKFLLHSLWFSFCCDCLCPHSEGCEKLSSKVLGIAWKEGQRWGMRDDWEKPL